MKRITVTTLAAFVALAFAASAGAQEAKPDGKTLFLDKKCNTCHTVKALGIEKRSAMAGEKTGTGTATPAAAKTKTTDLSSVGLDLKADWMTKFLKREEMTKAKKKHLLFKGTDEELTTVVTWLEEQKAPKAEAAPKAEKAPKAAKAKAAPKTAPEAAGEKAGAK